MIHEGKSMIAILGTAECRGGRFSPAALTIRRRAESVTLTVDNMYLRRLFSYTREPAGLTRVPGVENVKESFETEETATVTYETIKRPHSTR
jgi:hypothetical protein